MGLLCHSLLHKMMTVDMAVQMKKIQAKKKHSCNCKEDCSNIILHFTASNSLNECIDCAISQ
jgi:hypothetical protein